MSFFFLVLGYQQEPHPFRVGRRKIVFRREVLQAFPAQSEPQANRHAGGLRGSQWRVGQRGLLVLPLVAVALYVPHPVAVTTARRKLPRHRPPRPTHVPVVHHPAALQIFPRGRAGRALLVTLRDRRGGRFEHPWHHWAGQTHGSKGRRLPLALIVPGLGRRRLLAVAPRLALGALNGLARGPLGVGREVGPEVRVLAEIQGVLFGCLDGGELPCHLLGGDASENAGADRTLGARARAHVLAHGSPGERV